MKKKGMYINICTHIHTYNISFYIHRIKQYSAIEKKEILPFETTWIDLEGTMVSEVSQVEKDRYNMLSFIPGVSNKNSNSYRQ